MGFEFSEDKHSMGFDNEGELKLIMTSVENEFGQLSDKYNDLIAGGMPEGHPVAMLSREVMRRMAWTLRKLIPLFTVMHVEHCENRDECVSGSVKRSEERIQMLSDVIETIDRINMEFVPVGEADLLNEMSRRWVAAQN